MTVRESQSRRAETMRTDRLSAQAERERPFGRVFNDVDDISEVDYVGLTPLGSGCVHRVPSARRKA